MGGRIQPYGLLAHGVRRCGTRQVAPSRFIHTLASHAVMSGENLLLVGKLIGYRRHATTAGYAHLVRRFLDVFGKPQTERAKVASIS